MARRCSWDDLCWKRHRNIWNSVVLLAVLPVQSRLITFACLNWFKTFFLYRFLHLHVHVSAEQQFYEYHIYVWIWLVIERRQWNHLQFPSFMKNHGFWCTWRPKTDDVTSTHIQWNHWRVAGSTFYKLIPFQGAAPLWHTNSSVYTHTHTHTHTHICTSLSP